MRNTSTYDTYQAVSFVSKNIKSKSLKKTISGFLGLKALIDDTHKHLVKKSRAKKETKINPKYPLQFQQIRREFGGCYGLYDNLKRGTAMLSNDNELNQYLYSYGNMHQAKLDKTYKKLFESLDLSNNKKIEIIDYACGQGVASIVLLNYIENNFNYCLSNIEKITLVEPSEVALNRAEKILNQSANICTINESFDDLTETHFNSDQSVTKIHLLSNILDMGDEHFDMEHIAEVILKSQSGVNYFVCVSALNKGKLDYFKELFELFDGFTDISSFDGKFTNQQNWKMKFNIFKIGG